jgi:hypothetical protein
MQLRESQTFHRKISITSSRWKSKPREKSAEAGSKLSSYVPLKQWALSELHGIKTHMTVVLKNAVSFLKTNPFKRKSHVCTIIVHL